MYLLFLYLISFTPQRFLIFTPPPLRTNIFDRVHYIHNYIKNLLFRSMIKVANMMSIHIKIPKYYTKYQMIYCTIPTIYEIYTYVQYMFLIMSLFIHFKMQNIFTGYYYPIY